jgi:hypothetical protein
MSQIDRGRFQIVLAQMLLETGDLAARKACGDGAGGRCGSDRCLKMRAAWLIEDDDPDRAIQDLRIGFWTTMPRMRRR